MSSPTPQSDHWHQVVLNTLGKLRLINTGKASKKDVKQKSKYKQLLKQAKTARKNSLKR